ncbi:MAG: SRPBCC domain-containing protein, partial [Rhodospirillales bacterium]|nr:SRPBCC domain-containing protein [Rhodospirillales bacterium]
MPTGTVRLHRVLKAAPDKVYRAFTDADAMARWIAPYGFLCKVAHFEAKVGGTFRMSFVNFGTGNAHSFGGEFLELVPGKRLRYTDRFDDPNLPGTLTVTVELRQVLCGTELN